MEAAIYSHYRKWYTPNICVTVPRLVYMEHIDTNLVISFNLLCWTFILVKLLKRKKVINKPKNKVVWKDKIWKK